MPVLPTESGQSRSIRDLLPGGVSRLAMVMNRLQQVVIQ
jgi:hypothetical protein